MFYLICHNIRSLYNVGSIFRTADAFGIDKIILTGYTGTPKNPRLAKTSLGAEETVPWLFTKQLKRVIEKLKGEGLKIVALENNVTPPLAPPSKGGELGKFLPKFPLALLLGEEVKGIKQNFLKLCDEIVEIPMLGKKESLNVSVAAGIAMHHISSSKFKTQNAKPQLKSKNF